MDWFLVISGVFISGCTPMDRKYWYAYLFSSFLVAAGVAIHITGQ